MKPVSLKDFLVIILLLTFGIIALRSLIQNPFYTSHDGYTHTARIAAYYNALKDGQFPPRWAKNLNGNLGSPIFVYSYPLPYFIGSIFHFLGFSYQDSFRLVMGLPYLLSGIFAYFWLKTRFSRVASFTGAVFYLWAPYRFLNIYVRAALAESMAYTFLPLIFLGVDKIYQTKNIHRWWLLLFLATTAMFLSHNLVSAIFLPIIFAWTGLLFLQTKDRRSAILVLLAVVLSFLTSAFIYFPDLFERQFIHFDKSISYWQDHFVGLWQFVRSRWDYGFDFPGVQNDAMSFQLGLAQIFSLGLLLIVVFIKILDRASSLKCLSTKEAGFFLLSLFTVLFLMTDQPLAPVVWKNLPVMKTIIDFPWRFIGLTVFIFSYLTAFLLHITNNSKILAMTLIVFVIIANRNHLRINLPLNYSDSEFDNYHGSSTATSNEYNPIWHSSNNIPGNAPPLEIMNGEIKYQLINSGASGIDFIISDGQGTARINRFYFPETLIYRDGKLLKLGQDWNIIDDMGTIKLAITPPGGHYELRFEDTNLRKIANLVSVASLLFTLLVFWRFFKK